MKLAKTMLEAEKLLPRVRPATRNHRVSNKTPAAPEKKKITHSSSAIWVSLVDSASSAACRQTAKSHPTLASFVFRQRSSASLNFESSTGPPSACEVLSMHRGSKEKSVSTPATDVRRTSDTTSDEAFVPRER